MRTQLHSTPRHSGPASPARRPKLAGNRSLRRIFLAACLALALAVPASALFHPVVDGVEGPAFPPPPYMQTCFSSCPAMPGADFTEANAHTRLPGFDGSGPDCATQCRYFDWQPRIPLLTDRGGWLWTRSVCPPDMSANAEGYTGINGRRSRNSGDFGCGAGIVPPVE